MTNESFEYFSFRRIGKIGPEMQIGILVLFYIVTVFALFFEWQARGKVGAFHPDGSMLFVPIIEETIFRGIILKYFERYSKITALICSSLLFGLWHLRNIFWLDQKELITQILYTAFVFGPITALITQKCKSLWPAVGLHYLNNFHFAFWLG